MSAIETAPTEHIGELPLVVVQSVPTDTKYTPKRVSHQVRNLVFLTIILSLLNLVGLMVLLGNQNQTYRHITQTQDSTKRLLSFEQSLMTNKQDVILDKLEQQDEKK